MLLVKFGIVFAGNEVLPPLLFNYVVKSDLVVEVEFILTVANTTHAYMNTIRHQMPLNHLNSLCCAKSRNISPKC